MKKHIFFIINLAALFSYQLIGLPFNCQKPRETKQIEAKPIITKPYLHFKHPLEILKIVEQYLPENPVVLEAGAYDGTDSIEILKYFPKATIHSFEPIAYLYEKLKMKTSTFSSIHTYSLALGDSIGSATMYVSEAPWEPGIPSQSSSLLPPKEHLTYSEIQFKNTLTVSVSTIDAWAKQYNIDHIDFMWLDMQGFELNALMASPEIFKTVKVILTEVEFVEAYEGQYQFNEVKNWLESQGFIMIAENFGVTSWFGDALFVRK